MIRQIVFDMGNVLIHYRPQRYVQRLDVAEEDRPLLLREVFGSVEWIRLDRGSIGQEEAAAAMAAPAAAAGPVAEEKTEFDVVLAGFDAAAKIKVIKVVREITGLGLAEAKAVVEGTPKTLKEALSKEDAEAMKAKVEEAGGKVELK